MATKQVKVDIDVKSGSVKIAGEETIKLSRQVQILMKELEKTQKGTVEFELLSSKLNETKDRMSAVKAQSSELFSTFSMLPGPIGDIGSAADGTLSTLKTFSTFSFKDISTQFKGLFKDVGEVASNIGKATGITKLYATTSQLLAKGLNAVGISANAGSKGLKIFSGALVATGIGAIVVILGELIANFDKVRDTLYKMIPGLKAVGDAIGGVINWFTDLIGITSEAERAEEKRQATYAKNKANTEIVNKGIQREINLLKARGATQEEIDKKQKQMLLNRKKDLEGVANEQKKLYGEQGQEYLDIKNELAVIDAEATKRAQDEADKAAKDRQQKSAQANQKAIQQTKEFLQAQADAKVQNLKNEADTDEKALREALQAQYKLKNEGKKISAEVAKQQAAEIEQIVKEEVNKDKETRQKGFQEKLQNQKQFDKSEMDLATAQAEGLKTQYGENSKEYRDAVDKNFQTQAENLAKEKALLEEQKKTRDGLTEEQISRLKEITVEEQNVTNAKAAENQKRLQNDVETFLKSKEDEKVAREAKFTQNMELAKYDFEQQETLLKEKTEQDNKFYNEILANDKLNADQRKKIEQEFTVVKKQNADAQIAIEKGKSDAQAQILNFTAQQLSTFSDIVGKETAAGKALSVAAATIATYQGANSALKADYGIFGPAAQIARFIAVAATIGTGLKNVSSIVSVKVPTGGGGSAGTEQPRKLAVGGYVSGAGTGTSDSIPAYLSNGESVINANSTSMFRPLLSTINQIGGGRRFAEGGVVSQSQMMNDINSQLLNSSTQPIKTYVVAQDMTSMQMFDRAQKSRSTL